MYGRWQSGHIAAKAASTFSSTGTPAFFIHPTEAGHGDLGLVSGEDAVLVISYSGESGEILSLLSAFRQLQTPLVAIVGRPQSTLAGVSDICLSSAVEKEACPHNLAPTASTTVALALADSLAVTLLEARGFSADDFARCHPLGALGRRLLTCVSDVMRTGDEIPTVKADADFSEVLIEMTGKRMGWSWPLMMTIIYKVFLRTAIYAVPLAAIYKTQNVRFDERKSPSRPRKHAGRRSGALHERKKH